MGEFTIIVTLCIFYSLPLLQGTKAEYSFKRMRNLAFQYTFDFFALLRFIA